MRRDWIPWALLVLCILIPYWPLTTMQSVLITDDKFISDIFGGEFPFRVWMGKTLRGGELPLWIREGAQGAAAPVTDPLIAPLFAVLPPLVAMNLQLLGILLVATLGTYAFARTHRLTRVGASLAALAFGYSGFLVTQLKHVAFVEVVSLFPWALLCLERGLRGTSREAKRWPPRMLAFVGFGVVVALQVLAGFPQAVYYAFGAYGLYVFARSLSAIRGNARARKRIVGLFVALFACTLLGLGIGAVSLLTMLDVARGSDRAEGAAYEWASRFSYVPRNVTNFFAPYLYGDVSDGTYVGGGMFWEQYGYVGLFTILVALLAALLLFRNSLVRIFVAMAVVAYLVVLGPAVPGFRFVFTHVPGMSTFRFTTRAMFIVDFSLAMLAGIGLSHAQRDARWKIPPVRRTAFASAWLALAFGDLLFHQLRQNAYGDAKKFLAEPETARFLAGVLQVPGGGRYYAWDARNMHMLAHKNAVGWLELEPYEALLPLLEPNTNYLWGIPSVTAYSGLPQQLHADFWGSGNRHGVMWKLDAGTPRWLRILELHGVSFVLAPRPIESLGVPTHVMQGVFVYRLATSLPRAYVASRIVPVADVGDEVETLLSPEFRPGRDVVLPADVAPVRRVAIDDDIGAAVPARVAFTHDRNTRVALDVDAPLGGVLVIADTYFPAWRATIDGVEAPILRANHTQRAVALTPGRHHVELVFRWSAFRIGSLVSGGSLALLLALGARAARAARASRRTPTEARVEPNGA